MCYVLISIALVAAIFSIVHFAIAFPYGILLFLHPVIFLSFLLPPLTFGILGLVALAYRHANLGLACSVAACSFVALTFFPAHVFYAITRVLELLQ